MTFPQPSNNVGLVFDGALPVAGQPVNLTFGATPEPSEEFNCGVNAKIKIGGKANVFYDRSAFVGLHKKQELKFDSAENKARQYGLPWDLSSSKNVGYDVNFDEANNKENNIQLVWIQVQKLNAENNIAWTDSKLINAVTEIAFNNGLASQRQNHIVFDNANNQNKNAVLLFNYTTRRHLLNQIQFDDAKQSTVVSELIWHKRANRRVVRQVWPWNDGNLVLNGSSWTAPPTPQPLPPLPPVISDLKYCHPQPLWGGEAPYSKDVYLIFGKNYCGDITPDAPLYILPARFYMAIHSVYVQRLPDLTNVPLEQVSLSADVGSFSWQFNATGPASLMELLAPQAGLPVSIKIYIDGTPWVFLVESLRRSKQFGKTQVSVAGRSVTALIGSPFVREQSFNNFSQAKNAQQIALGALDLTGVDLDWQISDWLVPQSAFSLVSSPLGVVQNIAEAVGAYVQSHKSNSTLQVKHLYPDLQDGTPGGPWNWNLGAADVELAPDSIIVSDITRADGPDISGVYVSGQNQGVLAFVKRSGSDGAKQAEMIVDPLITALAAAQMRGLSILGQAGAKREVTLELPVLTGDSQPGVLEVGQLVQINETVPWRGRVRAVSVSASMPSVRQSVTLEQHL